MKETAAVLIDGPRRPAVNFAAAGELERPPREKRCYWGTRSLEPPKKQQSSPPVTHR